MLNQQETRRLQEEAAAALALPVEFIVPNALAQPPLPRPPEGRQDGTRRVPAVVGDPITIGHPIWYFDEPTKRRIANGPEIESDDHWTLRMLLEGVMRGVYDPESRTWDYQLDLLGLDPVGDADRLRAYADGGYDPLLCRHLISPSSAGDQAAILRQVRAELAGEDLEPSSRSGASQTTRQEYAIVALQRSCTDQRDGALGVLAAAAEEAASGAVDGDPARRELFERRATELWHELQRGSELVEQITGQAVLPDDARFFDRLLAPLVARPEAARTSAEHLTGLVAALATAADDALQQLRLNRTQDRRNQIIDLREQLRNDTGWRRPHGRDLLLRHSHGPFPS